VAKHGRGENIYLIRFHYVRAPSKWGGVVRLDSPMDFAWFLLENRVRAERFPDVG
jgi:hypothetical protein